MIDSMIGTYDVIFFDWSTSKFATWQREHLAILYNKLKDGGMLFIDVRGPATFNQKTLEAVFGPHVMITHEYHTLQRSKERPQAYVAVKSDTAVDISKLLEQLEL